MEESSIWHANRPSIGWRWHELWLHNQWKGINDRMAVKMVITAARWMNSNDYRLRRVDLPRLWVAERSEPLTSVDWLSSEASWSPPLVASFWWVAAVYLTRAAFNRRRRRRRSLIKASRRTTASLMTQTPPGYIRMLSILSGRYSAECFIKQPHYKAPTSHR